MRFDTIPDDDDDRPIKPTSSLPSPDQTSRAVRMRLVMLLTMLVMVFYAMIEAGKPERWEWMGFDRLPNNAERTLEIDDASLPTQPDNTATTTPANVPSDSESVDKTRESPAISFQSENSRQSSNPIVRIGLDAADYPPAAVTFWDATYRKLSDDQQHRLLLLLKRMRLSQTIPEPERDATKVLVGLLAQQRSQFHQKLFDQLATTSEGTEEKSKIANDLYESQAKWDDTVLPAMKAAVQGQDFTISQQNAIVQLQEVLDPLLYQEVHDQTSIGWSGDGAAWKRIWEKITSHEMPPGESVSHIQLMSQPEIYRGKPVTTQGWVRSARKKTLPGDSTIGLPHYYILWVRPKESKLGPYCVYSMTLPDGFPALSNEFSAVNENVLITGYSFKVRTYVAADSSVKNSPVVLAPTVKRIETRNFVSANQWHPSRPTLIVAFILIPLLATGLAWWAFLASGSKKHEPGKKMKAHINQSLNDLTNDPNIETDRERVMKLYDAETDNE